MTMPPTSIPAHAPIRAGQTKQYSIN